MVRGVIAQSLPCLAGVGGFLLAALALGPAAPPFVPEVTPKLEFLTEHKDDFDAVFVGSSRIFHGVSPKIFDETLRKAGCPSRSFNAAADAMGPPESISWVRRLAALKPRGLKRVFLELSALQEVPQTPGKTTVRDVYWQDAGAMRFAARRLEGDLRERRPFREALSRFAMSLRLFAQNESNVGRGLDWFGKGMRFVLGPDGDGFFPMSDPLSAEGLAKYHAGLKQIAQGIAQRFDPINEEEYARLAADLAAKGISLVLVAPPTTNIGALAAMTDCPPGSPLFLFNEPERFPILYQDDNRLDYEHLNGKGAAIFSRLLAERFASHLGAAAR